MVLRRGKATPSATRQSLPKEVWVLASANFVIAAGFGIVAPALPMFARSFNVSITAASFVISAFAIARLVFAPVAGKLITAIGERKVYLSGLLIVAVSTGACAFAATYGQLLAFRSFGGIGSTMFTVSAIALLIRITPQELRGRATGLFGAGFLAGNVTGPLAGSGLIVIDLRAPFIFYAIVLIIATALVWLLMRGSTLVEEADKETAPAVRLGNALKEHSYRSALLANFATGWTVFGVRVSLVPLFLVEVLRRDESFAGIAFAVFAAANLAALLPAGRVADSIGRKPLVLSGLVIAAIGTGWIGFTDTVTEFLIATVLAGAGMGVLHPPKHATVADIVGSKGRGGPVLATFQMSADIGAIIGPMLTGILADEVSYLAAFLVTGALSLIAALVWLPARETLPTREPTQEQAPEQSCEMDTREQQ